MRSERLLWIALAWSVVGRADAQEIDWTRPPALTADRPFTPPHATRVALDGGVILLVALIINIYALRLRDAEVAE